jgi:2-C-methyl-D-erythritol 4-phosphate cytidylyltransferase
MNAWAIIAAAGIGKRMGGDRPKQYLELGGKPVVCHTLERFVLATSIQSVVIVVEPGREAAFRSEIIERNGFPATWKIVAGGSVRQESVLNGLRALPDDCDVVAVHDGVRPFISPLMIDRSVEIAFESGACVVATPVKETIKKVRAGDATIEETVDRSQLWGAKTPQTFRKDVLLTAMQKALEEGFLGTDEASIVERLGVPVRILEGDDRNIKLTTPADLRIAEAILEEWNDASLPL